MDLSSPDSTRQTRLAIDVQGVVQGVGFRPFVRNLAQSLSLSGWVRNETDQVRIEVQGSASDVTRFVEDLGRRCPPQARIERLDHREIPCPGGAAQPFEILASQADSAPRPSLPADLAICDACLAEIRDPAARRYRYPFTNCTNCGPRWSIIRQLPYDRPRTSMADFPMCPDCHAEYADPTDRRFHAQPIACPRCGPTLRLLDRQGVVSTRGDAALSAAVEAIVGGQIVAIQGLGGFQLVCDATQIAAVAQLRERKQRPHKPLAVMLASMDEARRRCRVSEIEARELTSPRAPIVLLRARTDDDRLDDLAPEVAPGNPTLGVMLPYTPLHYLLMDGVRRPIVCTSGNVSEEPMAIDAEDALERLSPIADLLLVHDRPIVRPVDDSVIQCIDSEVQVVRRARGYAPLPVALPEDGPTVLALGGHLKNTVGLALGNRAVLSPHIGDLDNVSSVDVHDAATADLTKFFEVVPECVVCDLHPDYASTRHAEQLASVWNVPLLRVQHHHAHVATCIAEHRIRGPILGLAWDGTGYGTDGTVWGGEALLCEGAGYCRVGHWRTFALPGGDRATREPRRSALGLLFELLGRSAERCASAWFEESETALLLQMLDRSLQSPRTSSMGRLFDAVAALCGLSRVASHEGQAAMALQFAAEEDDTDETYPLDLVDEEPMVLDWGPMVRCILDDVPRNTDPARIGRKFHNTLADAAVRLAERVGCPQVALTGGCFQNELLSRLVSRQLAARGFQVFIHREVPPGDGGIALGQLAIARKRKEA